MNPNDLVSARVATPLCDATHKIRAKLLGASAIGIVIFHTGLVPGKIEGLGIEFTAGQQNAMVWCLLGLVIYLLMSFLISAAADVVSTRLQAKGRFEAAMLATITEATEKAKDGNENANAWYSVKKAVSNISKQMEVSLGLVTFLSRIRFAWDAIMPIVVAFYSIAILFILLNHGVTR
jgi:hypothetical protein